ncbi:hypothetical protein CHISP_0501 [Chitinispirillum alkaliphilum]|nr:hypothetical protein CHISP_0501 [Chitinispirillum alkaliphilum]
MDAVSGVAASIDAVNDVLKMTSSEVVKAAEQHVKVAVEMAVGHEVGKGELIDLIA